MPKRKKKHRGCDGKKRYDSQKEAWAAVYFIRQGGNTSPDQVLNAYKCSHCGKYHVGRAPQMKSNRGNRR